MRLMVLLYPLRSKTALSGKSKEAIRRKGVGRASSEGGRSRYIDSIGNRIIAARQF